MNRIHMFCGQIQTAGGFEYKLPSDILKQTLNGDCEQSWYSKDGHLLADPSDPHKLSDPVISVSSDHLITSHCVDQLHHGIECDIDGSYYSRQTRFRAFSFEKNIADISVSCGEIQTDEGFEYRLQSNLLNQTVNGDCDQSWYLEDGHLLADPSDPHKLMYPVTSVSSDRLVTSDCVNLNHEIICHSNNLRFEIMFRVFNDTDSSGGSTQTPDSYQFWWISALFFIMILAFLCFLLRKRISRYFLKAEKSNFQLSDSEIRDPESAVQKKLRSDESDSLNHTESEQINGSCPEDHPVITLNVIH